MNIQSITTTANESPRPKRRWLQFSLRTLLVMMLVFGCGLGWAAAEWRKIAKYQGQVDAIRKLGGFVQIVEVRSNRPQWLNLIIGDDSFRNTISIDFWENRMITDAGLEQLGGLPNIQRLDLNYQEITDAGMKHLEGQIHLRDLLLCRTRITDKGLKHVECLKDLDRLWLHNTQITDSGLERLQTLTKLHWLVLDNTKITDLGLVHLQALPQIKVLKLSGTKITDAGLIHLKCLTQLKELELNNTQVTDEGVEDLKKAIPNCLITR